MSQHMSDAPCAVSTESCYCSLRVPMRAPDWACAMTSSLRVRCPGNAAAWCLECRLPRWVERLRDARCCGERPHITLQLQEHGFKDRRWQAVEGDHHLARSSECVS